jgi:nitrate/nitrite transport system substrate-binding protein
MWFMTQHKRWGLLKGEVDYLGTASSVNQTKLYAEGAALAKVSVPKSAMRTVKMIDGTVWDGKNPKAYADAFKIKA